MNKDILGYVFLLVVSIGLVQYEIYSYKSDDADYKDAYVRILNESSLSEKDSKAIVAVIQSEANRNRAMVTSVANVAIFMVFAVFVSLRMSKRKDENEVVGIKNHA